MSPIAKFHSYVVAITVAIMFFSVNQLTKFVESSDAMAAGVVLAALSSLGVYKLIASAILLALAKWNWLFKFTLGPYYLKGTWGGFVHTKTGKPRLIVEKYEQSLSHIIVFGYSYDLNGKKEANWNTKAVQVSPGQGELFCFFTVNVPYKEAPVEALGRLQFDRASGSSAPTKMTGYTIDSDATQKLIYEDLHKLDEQLLPIDQAKEQTFEYFKERIEKSKKDLNG